MPTTFLSLPFELFAKIIGALEEDEDEVYDLDPVLALRATCRTFRDMCWAPEIFPKTFFEETSLMFTHGSLKELHDIADHPVLGPQLRDLLIISTRFAWKESPLDIVENHGFVYHKGEHMTMLGQALTKLPNCKSVEIMDGVDEKGEVLFKEKAKRWFEVTTREYSIDATKYWMEPFSRVSGSYCFSTLLCALAENDNIRLERLAVNFKSTQDDQYGLPLLCLNFPPHILPLLRDVGFPALRHIILNLDADFGDEEIKFSGLADAQAVANLLPQFFELMPHLDKLEFGCPDLILGSFWVLERLALVYFPRLRFIHLWRLVASLETLLSMVQAHRATLKTLCLNEFALGDPDSEDDGGDGDETGNNVDPNTWLFLLRSLLDFELDELTVTRPLLQPVGDVRFRSVEGKEYQDLVAQTPEAVRKEINRVEAVLRGCGAGDGPDSPQSFEEEGLMSTPLSEGE